MLQEKGEKYSWGEMITLYLSWTLTGLSSEAVRIGARQDKDGLG